MCTPREGGAWHRRAHWAHTGGGAAAGPQRQPGCNPGMVLGGSHPDRRWATPPPNSHQEINRLLPAASNVHTWERLGFTDSVFQQREDKFLGQSGNPTAGHLRGQDLLVQIPGVR